MAGHVCLCVHDLDDDPDTDSTYECLSCGELVRAVDRPGDCPACGGVGTFRNQAYSLE